MEAGGLQNKSPGARIYRGETNKAGCTVIGWVINNRRGRRGDVLRNLNYLYTNVT